MVLLEKFCENPFFLLVDMHVLHGISWARVCSHGVISWVSWVLICLHVAIWECTQNFDVFARSVLMGSHGFSCAPMSPRGFVHASSPFSPFVRGNCLNGRDMRYLTSEVNLSEHIFLFSFYGLRFFLSEVALEIGRSAFLSQNHRTLC